VLIVLYILISLEFKMKDYKNFKIAVDAIDFFETTIQSTLLVDCLQMTNTYLESLYKIFSELNFDLFEVLGQRNLSGLIGEIFSRYVCNELKICILNPHPDGRPDILNIQDKKTKKYFEEECFSIVGNRRIPLKAKFTPFKYGGIEVKCTIGSPINNYKKILFEKTGKRDFAMGMPRINYLDSFNYWAHHRHSTNLVCLYYDYYESKHNIPQVLSIFSVSLNENDWNVVSLGKTSAKKTSNTSLNKDGRKKLYSSCIAIVDDSIYINKFSKIGITF